MNMNDYPPSRVVLDIFTLCQELREQGMALIFEQRDMDEHILLTVMLFNSVGHTNEWADSDDVEPIVSASVRYDAEGYGYDGLCSLFNSLKQYKKEA